MRGRCWRRKEIGDEPVRFFLCPHDLDPLPEASQDFVSVELERFELSALRFFRLDPDRNAAGQENDPIRPAIPHIGNKLFAPTTHTYHPPNEIPLDLIFPDRQPTMPPFRRRFRVPDSTDFYGSIFTFV